MWEMVGEIEKLAVESSTEQTAVRCIVGGFIDISSRETFLN